MKKNIAKLSIVIYLLLFGLVAQGQEEKISPKDINPVTLDALKTLSVLNQEKTGSKGMEGVGNPRLGNYYVIYWVGLDQLKGYKKSGDIKKMLSGGDQVIYWLPVKGMGMQVTSITLSKKDGNGKLRVR